jgi:diguanylate cyclase (GGDEF)-like protein
VPRDAPSLIARLVRVYARRRLPDGAPPSRRRLRRLLAQGALVAGTLVAVAAAALWLVRAETASRAKHEVARDARVIADTLLSQVLTAEDLAGPAGVRRRREVIEPLIRRAVLGALAESVTLYSPDGSRAHTFGPGVLRADPAEVRRALARERVLGTGASPASGPSAPRREVVAALAPIRLHPGAPPVGVLQIEQDLAPVAASVGATVARAAAVLAATLLAVCVALLALLSRVSRRLRREAAESARIAQHDALTGLPNRALFAERAAAAVQDARRGGPGPAIILVDLDGFKEINDTLGHEAGDRVLEEVARRLAALVRETDLVARLGGDELALLLPGAGAGAAGLVRTVGRALEQPVTLQGLAIAVRASCGIAVYPDDGEDVDALMRAADTAMYRAKGARSGIVVEDGGAGGRERRRATLAPELGRALAEGEIELRYQPAACLRTGRIAGVEALVR